MRSNPIVDATYHSLIFTGGLEKLTVRDQPRLDYCQRQLYLVKNCFILCIDLGSGSAAPSAPYDLVSSLLDPKHGVLDIRITSQNTHIALSWPHLVFHLRHLLTFGANPHLHHRPDPSFEMAHWRWRHSHIRPRVWTSLLEEDHSGTVNLYKKTTTNTIEVFQCRNFQSLFFINSGTYYSLQLHSLSNKLLHHVLHSSITCRARWSNDCYCCTPRSS